MKHKHSRQTAIRQPMYPNAADTQYFEEKALEILAAIFTSIGIISLMVFLITMA